MKKILMTLFLSLLALTSCSKTTVEPIVYEKDNSKTQIYFFHGAECPACAIQKQNWEEFLPDFPKTELISFEVWHSKVNSQLMTYIAEQKWIRLNSVPVSIIWDKIYVWVNSDPIKEELKKCENSELWYCKDQTASLIKKFNTEVLWLITDTPKNNSEEEIMPEKK